MAATTSPAVVTGPTVVTGTSVVTGQGNYPLLWLLYSTDDASVSVPTWNDATGKCRGFQTNRGRDDTLSTVDAGTATITLDARDRTFDPNNNAALRPMNRWWIRSQFSGETQDVFVGYATSYDIAFPGSGSDSVTTVNCSDEFMPLSLVALPVTDPPRDTYAEVVQFDNPTGYWQFNVSSLTAPFDGTVGEQLIANGGGFGMTGPGPILGGEGDLFSVYQKGVSGGYLQTNALSTGGAGDVSGHSAVSVETWYNTSSLASGAGALVTGPTAGSASTYALSINSSGVVSMAVRNSAGTLATASGGALAVNTWYHLCGTWDGTTVTVYVNGAVVGTASLSGSFASTLDAGAFLRVADPTASDTNAEWDEVAVYNTTLSASRVAAHYNAGFRGFSYGFVSGTRLQQILDSITSHAPRSLYPGSRAMYGLRQTGQAPLDGMREAQRAELADGVLFVSRSGAVTFLDSGHRLSSPYNTTQAVYGDGTGAGWTLDTSALDTTTVLSAGAELPYTDLGLDYSDQFLYNEWNVTRRAGTLVTVRDDASVARYYKRALSEDSLQIIGDADVATIASQLLAKFKTPLNRVTSISPKIADPNTALVTFERDLGDRIEILRSPLGGGRIDQVSYIQRIQVNADRSNPIWNVTLGVSPV